MLQLMMVVVVDTLGSAVVAVVVVDVEEGIHLRLHYNHNLHNIESNHKRHCCRQQQEQIQMVLLLLLLLLHRLL